MRQISKYRERMSEETIDGNKILLPSDSRLF